MLKLSNVSKNYASPDGGAPVEILKKISLELAVGEAIAIVGPSGSGKSTLLNIMGALDRPTSGTVQIGDRDFATLNESGLAYIRNHEIGFIFQLHHLLPQCSILENVLIPTLTNPAELQTEAALKRAEQLLERVGLKHRLSHRPGQLSGGECQRVAVVRALINQPRLLLADEPTGALDYSNGLSLMMLLLELNLEAGVTLIVVTHADGFAQMLSRHYLLQDGCLK